MVMNSTGDYVGISRLPVSVTAADLEGARAMHESCLRSYQILYKVKWLLEKKTDPEVIAELIALMERNDLLVQELA